MAVLRSSQFKVQNKIYLTGHFIRYTWPADVQTKHHDEGGKGDLDDFERGMVVSLRILDTADLLEFSLTTICWGLLRMIRKELLQFSG